MLNSLHTRGHIDQAPLDVSIDWHTKRKVVNASEDLLGGSLAFPPCVPHTSRMYDKSWHPHRVPITVTERSAVAERKPDTRVRGKAACEPSQSFYYVHPEYMMPEENKDTIDDQAASHARAWEFKGDETLHPFWAV